VGLGKWVYGGWQSVQSARKPIVLEPICNLRMIPVEIYIPHSGFICGTASLHEVPPPLPLDPLPTLPSLSLPELLPFQHDCLIVEIEEIPEEEIPLLTFEEEEEMNQQIPEVYPKPEYPGIDEFLITEREPRALNLDEVKKAIGYPLIARDAGIEGTVVVRILVHKNGAYQRHELINAVHPILTRAVEAHISKLRFEPALQGGRTISYWVNIPFTFRCCFC